MGKETGIMWCHHTFNAVWGCTKVDAGCGNCYAETWSTRWGFDVWGPNTSYREFGDKHWNEPLRWNRDAAAAGERRRCFGGSMNDPMDPDWKWQWDKRYWDLIRATKHLDWLILTKRPENILAKLPPDWGHGWPHVWFLVSAHDHASMVKRIRILRQVPCICRGVSLEPMLGPVKACDELSMIDWLIIGGESGPGAKEFPIDSATQLLRGADMMRLPVFFKQFGSVLAGEYGWKNSKGEDPSEWPARYRRQQFPLQRGKRCVRCGCIDTFACAGGCSWASNRPPICSACFKEAP